MHIEMKLLSNGDLIFSANGATTTCSSGVAVSSGASSVQIGAESIGPGHWGEVRLDNVTTYVRR
jgi:hypothetical protein